MFSMRPQAVPSADDRFDAYPGFVKKSEKDRKNAGTPVSITDFVDTNCGFDYDTRCKFGSGNSFSTSSDPGRARGSHRGSGSNVSPQEVFELELDWTPVGLEEAPLPKSRKTSRGHDSDSDDQLEPEAAIVFTGNAAKNSGAVSTCRCAYCSQKPEDRSKVEATGSRGTKRGPSSPPPSKKALIVGSPAEEPGAIEKPIPVGRSPIPNLYHCDDDFEYTSEAYDWRKDMEQRQWTGCQMALANQVDLTSEMRQTLLVWLSAVNSQFNFSLETWCLTVSLIDRFLSIQPLKRDCLQLVGLTAFFVAAKLEEVEPPQISELINFCAGSYDKKQFLWMELIMLSHLKFEILSPTASFFLHHQVEMERLQESWPYDVSIVLIERALCDEWLSNVRSSTLSRVIFDAIVENWHPELYPDDIVDDDDFVDHLYGFVQKAVKAP